MIVTVMGELPAVALSTLLTQVTAAVCGALTQSLGVFWTNAVMLIRKDVFISFATQLLPKGPPLPIWVDFRVGRAESGSASAGFTAGLTALGLMEIEAPDATEPPPELRQRLEAIAQYLVEHGLVIKDGDTVGNSASEKIRVTYAPSTFGTKGDVMRLSYEKNAVEKKSWWQRR